MAEAQNDQRPLSRAYLSLCPANRTTNKQVQEEKASSQDYLAQGQKENHRELHVKSVIRANLMKAGFPQQKVDEVMSKVETMPEPLVKAYYDMLKEEVVSRIRKDEDYVNSKLGGSQYDFLDKL